MLLNLLGYSTFNARAQRNAPLNLQPAEDHMQVGSAPNVAVALGCGKGGRAKRRPYGFDLPEPPVEDEHVASRHVAGEAVDST